MKKSATPKRIVKCTILSWQFQDLLKQNWITGTCLLIFVGVGARSVSYQFIALICWIIVIYNAVHNNTLLTALVTLFERMNMWRWNWVWRTSPVLAIQHLLVVLRWQKNGMKNQLGVWRQCNIFNSRIKSNQVTTLIEIQQFNNESHQSQCIQKWIKFYMHYAHNCDNTGTVY